MTSDFGYKHKPLPLTAGQRRALTALRWSLFIVGTLLLLLWVVTA